MSRVQCFLCEFEQGGFCLKKKQNSKPLKIEVNKKRSCSLYSEDGVKVLNQYRKKEAHKVVLQRQEIRHAQLLKAIEQAKAAGIKAFTEE